MRIVEQHRKIAAFRIKRLQPARYARHGFKALFYLVKRVIQQQRDGRGAHGVEYAEQTRYLHIYAHIALRRVHIKLYAARRYLNLAGGDIRALAYAEQKLFIRCALEYLGR
ncbi:hypothetical protein SDC9_167934 [bioreactor metagenome]|uniref:Uncharacterized protein n=1 Tax=bioreactor metagenome TaxID=1076179 RepID=A0A645G1P1_9ZZZZ